MPLERVSQGFRDISMSFQVNPLNNDLIALKNDVAISRSIRNIVFTLPGEKFFTPNFGSAISRSLFENVSETSAIFVKDEIENSIRNYEPRVELIDVLVRPNYDDNQLEAVIKYRVIGVDLQVQKLQFVLQPSR